MPNPPGDSQDDFQCDPELILKGIALREEWDVYIAEGRESLKAFNKELSRAIASDKMSKGTFSNDLVGTAPSNGTNTTSTENQSSRSLSAEDNETAAERVDGSTLNVTFVCQNRLFGQLGEDSHHTYSCPTCSRRSA